jgi:hypothetical protein
MMIGIIIILFVGTESGLKTSGIQGAWKPSTVIDTSPE